MNEYQAKVLQQNQAMSQIAGCQVGRGQALGQDIRPGDVPSAINELAESVSVLEASTERLLTRLRSVTLDMDNEAKTGSGMAPEPVRSDLSTHIHTQVHRVRALAAMLDRQSRNLQV